MELENTENFVWGGNCEREQRLWVRRTREEAEALGREEIVDMDKRLLCLFWSLL